MSYIVDIGLTQLFHTEVDMTYWNDSFQAAVYLLNRLPTKALQGNISPYELLYKRLPNYIALRVFGCYCYPRLRHLPQYKF